MRETIATRHITVMITQQRGKVTLTVLKIISQCKIKNLNIFHIIVFFWAEMLSFLERFPDIPQDMNTVIWHREVKILSLVLSNVCQRTTFKSLRDKKTSNESK